METRASKRKANLSQNQNQPPKKKRVPLGELTNLTNLTVPQTSQPDKPKSLNKNPKPKKAPARKKTQNVNDNDIDAAQSSTHGKLDGPFVSEIYRYLRTIEVNMFVRVYIVVGFVIQLKNRVFFFFSVYSFRFTLVFQFVI